MTAVASSHASGIALMYHDVIPMHRAEESGLKTEGAWRYKIDPGRFERHIAEINRTNLTPTRVTEVDDASETVLVTFDDGGAGTYDHGVPVLKDYDVPGHFFVVTGRIGDRNFLSREQIHSLAGDGHVVGSHTDSHPDLVNLSAAEQRRELARSKETIEAITGADCVTLSIPNGRFDERSLEIARDVGYEYVFTSEPVALQKPITPWAKLGRFAVWHDTTATDLRQVLLDPLHRLRIRSRWYTLNATKSLVGRHRFVALRDRLYDALGWTRPR